MVTGQSGVGKEVVAREIHRLDPKRAGARFVAVNCGGIPETLLEAELFGHERGAYTGAIRQKRGLLEQARGGTLFLDEIGDMPTSMQIKLLRVLQERAVTRLGAEQAIPVDFRLICATHRDLRKLVEQGSFREDLFYRINVVNVRVPPLRDRPEDIIWYARRFLRETAQNAGEPVKMLSGAAEQLLLAHLWPGNVRELRHCVERAFVMTSGSVLDPHTLFDDSGDPERPRDTPSTLASFLQDCEKRYLIQELTRHDWHMGETAKAIGISRKNLWERLRRLDIQAPGRALREDGASSED